MQNYKKNNTCLTFIIGALVGLIIFIAIYGFDVIKFTNDSLIINGYIEKDIAQHYGGWMLYRNSPWRFPLGLGQNIAYPYGTVVSYTDSIPLLAIFFKIFRDFLPATFQYFGFYCLLCFMLQGAFGSLISNLFSKNIITDILASAVFVLSPIMIERAFRHCGLTSHFLILSALYFYFCNKGKTDFKAYLPFFIINVLAITIHPYFLPFTFGIMFAFAVEQFFINKKIVSAPAYVVFSIIFTLLIGYIIGAFYSTGSMSSFGYGFFNMNLNALINPMSRGFTNWSSVLPVRPNILGQPEAFSYLGLGIILMIPISAFIAVLHYKLNIFKECFEFIFNYYGIIFSAAALFIFAVGDWIMFDEIQIYRIPFPASLMEGLFGIFRANGRFTWLLIYAIVIAIIFCLTRCNKITVTNLLLALLILIQVYDLKDVLNLKHSYFTGSEGDLQGQVYEKILKNSIWDDAAEKYEICTMISSGIANSGIEISVKFGKNGHAANTAFEARVDYPKAERLSADTLSKINQGALPENELVMINDINENILNDCIENGYSLYRVETDHLICKNKFSTEEIQKYTSEGNFEIIYSPDFL